MLRRDAYFLQLVLPSDLRLVEQCLNAMQLQVATNEHSANFRTFLRFWVGKPCASNATASLARHTIGQDFGEFHDNGSTGSIHQYGLSNIRNLWDRLLCKVGIVYSKIMHVKRFVTFCIAICLLIELKPSRGPAFALLSYLAKRC